MAKYLVVISPSFSPTDNQLEKLLILNLELAEKKLLVLGHQRSVKGDRWIDAIVYELYRLIEEEVAIGEPFFTQANRIPSLYGSRIDYDERV